MRSFFVSVALLFASVAYSGVVQKIPPVTASNIDVFDSRTFYVVGGEQEDYEGSQWSCMPLTRMVESLSGYFGLAHTTLFSDNYECTSDNTVLKDWDADADGSWIYFDAFKPPGTKWTATKLECMLNGPLPSETSATEDIRFAVGWRDADSAVIESDVSKIVTLDSNDALGVSVSSTPELVIGNTSDGVGMVVVFQTDADVGGTDYNDLNVICSVTIKVE